MFILLIRNRYAEQILPALAMAQRKLIERIRSFEGVPPPQPHFAKYLQEKGMKTITERTYTSVQLVVGVIKTARQRMKELGLLKKVCCSAHVEAIQEKSGRK